jgi:hypothetical protein
MHFLKNAAQYQISGRKNNEEIAPELLTVQVK